MEIQPERLIGLVIRPPISRRALYITILRASEVFPKTNIPYVYVINNPRGNPVNLKNYLVRDCLLLLMPQQRSKVLLSSLSLTYLVL